MGHVPNKVVGGVSTPLPVGISGTEVPPTGASPAADFAGRLLAWHREHGRHDLPWQQPRTPYRVWISEIMLQQTRVEAVVPYFERFIAAFPDVHALAAADLDQVLSLWSGLGYYARARNLHRSASLVVELHGGELPADLMALQALPGIGRSTAAAILSMGFDEPAAILDGNVKRVLARHELIEGWPGAGTTLRKLWASAEQLLPAHDASAYSQGLMDLGASICSRSSPQCEACPLQLSCRAHAQGRTGEIPAARPKKPLPTRKTRMLILRDTDSQEIFLSRRPASGIWGGLWSLPEQETGVEDVWLPPGLHAAGDPVAHQPRPHVFSHFRLEIVPLEIPVQRRGIMETGRGVWYKPHDALQLGLPRPVRTIIESLNPTCPEPSSARN